MTKMSQRNAKPVVIAIVSALMSLGNLCLSDTLAQVKPSAATDASKPTSAPTTQAEGVDWPKWAGPEGNYTSPEKGLLREWPADGPQVLWRAKIGQGWSSPVRRRQRGLCPFDGVEQYVG